MNFTIYMESTPNPEVMKFVANKILTEDSIELLNNKNSDQVPLAMELLNSHLSSLFLLAITSFQLQKIMILIGTIYQQKLGSSLIII